MTIVFSELVRMIIVCISALYLFRFKFDCLYSKCNSKWKSVK